MPPGFTHKDPDEILGVLKRCAACRQLLPIDKFYGHASSRDGHARYCKECNNHYNLIRNHRLGLTQPYDKNTKCTLYLGVEIAERLLASTFKNATAMPMGNPGFDFICGKGYKVDVKSSRRLYAYGKYPHWTFTISRNLIPDFFACLAFDARKCPDLLHYWLIPSEAVNDKVGLVISESKLEKWGQYEKTLQVVK